MADIPRCPDDDSYEFRIHRIRYGYPFSSPTQSLPVNRVSLQGKARDCAPLLNAAFREYKGPAFAIRFWDDSMWYSETKDVDFLICLRTQKAWDRVTALWILGAAGVPSRSGSAPTGGVRSAARNRKRC